MQIFALLLGAPFFVSAQSQTDKLSTPHFHHIHLNSTDPDAAIAFYTKAFPSAEKATFEGYPALKINKVYVLFTKVSTPPPTMPQSAIWHFGWQVVDVRKNLATYKANGTPLLPLYKTEEVRRSLHQQ